MGGGGWGGNRWGGGGWGGRRGGWGRKLASADAVKSANQYGGFGGSQSMAQAQAQSQSSECRICWWCLSAGAVVGWSSSLLGQQLRSGISASLPSPWHCSTLAHGLPVSVSDAHCCLLLYCCCCCSEQRLGWFHEPGTGTISG